MINIKSTREISLMRKAGEVLEATFSLLEGYIKPGISTLELDKLAEQFIRSHHCLPSFKGYQGFPGSICASVNDVLVHGIPRGDIVLKDGDIISVDCGTIFQGYQADAARTFAVGAISEEAAKLIEVTKESFFRAIEFAVNGNHLSDISHEIQTYCEAHGYSLPRDYMGHGIGREMHEDPMIPNFGPSGHGPVLKTGMCLAIEPMVHQGSQYTTTDSDGWTVRTADGKLSAHYENTIVITSSGCEILTLQNWRKQNV